MDCSKGNIPLWHVSYIKLGGSQFFRLPTHRSCFWPQKQGHRGKPVKWLFFILLEKNAGLCQNERSIRRNRLLEIV